MGLGLMGLGLMGLGLLGLGLMGLTKWASGTNGPQMDNTAKHNIIYGNVQDYKNMSWVLQNGPSTNIEAKIFFIIYKYRYSTIYRITK